MDLTEPLTVENVFSQPVSLGLYETVIICLKLTSSLYLFQECDHQIL